MRSTVRMALMSAALLAGSAAAATMPAVQAASASRVSSAVRPCSAGLVALTFDDGPARGLTAKLVGILDDRGVPATFFMVGSRVHTAPHAARVVARHGFAIGNHTWDHPRLTRLSDGAIATEIRRTARELRRIGVRPGPLMRPPYGEVDARVRSVVSDLGLVPVLWTVDSNDWRGGSARQIADSVLRQLRPHRTNIVLQHDGVRNSPASVAAVPRIVRIARHRGYCFARLGRHGGVVPPVPAVGTRVYAGSETGPTAARVLLTLSTPTSRVVSLRVRATSGTAIAGEDFAAIRLRVSFPVGVTHAWVNVPVLDDTTAEPVESFHVLLDAPDGVTIPKADRLGTITSDELDASRAVG